MSPTIYVAIACYRDLFLQSTIDSLYRTAKNPEAIRVGCFIQERYPEKPLISDNHGYKVSVDSQEPGKVFSVCECRNRSLKFLSNEEFVLQIDSHMRFDDNWDETLLKDFHSLSNSKALLSTGLSSFKANKDGSDERFKILNLRTFEFNNEQSRKTFLDCYELVGQPNFVKGNNDPIRRDWYLCGHFIFGPSKFFKDIVQPEWVGFWGEEIINSIRAFTAGWDVYSVRDVPIYHLDEHISNTGRPRLWEDYPDQYFSNRHPTTDRIIDTLIGKSIEDLFTERSLNEFNQVVGYDIGAMFDHWRKEYGKQ